MNVRLQEYVFWRWSLVAAIFVAASLYALSHRYMQGDYCHETSCVIVDRWTGQVFERPTQIELR